MATVARPRILVVSDGERQASPMCRAFQLLGCDATATSLAAIRFDSSTAMGIAIPGFDGALPDAVLVRAIAAGSFEAVTRRLGLLHAFERLSIPVWNSAQAIERCVDKSMTSFLLTNAGVATPDSFAVEGHDEAIAIVERECGKGPLVAKPLFGAQGRGIVLVRNAADLPPEDEVAGVYYLQRHVDRPGPPYRDFRVFVCDGKVISAMIRRGDDWVTNIHRGAEPEPADDLLTARLGETAVAAAAAVGAAFAGVDLIEVPSGAMVVLEVNSMPAWAGLQSVSSVDIAGAIATSLVKSLSRQARPTGRPAANGG